MALRLLYDMGNRGWLPEWFASINPTTRTPINSTLFVVLLMLFFAILLSMVTLAEMTSLLILIVFALINLALIKIKQKHLLIKKRPAKKQAANCLIDFIDIKRWIL